jgi:hypothetical protein
LPIRVWSTSHSQYSEVSIIYLNVAELFTHGRFCNCGVIVYSLKDHPREEYVLSSCLILF